MLAFTWAWLDAARDQSDRDGARLGASLCAGLGGYAGAADIAGLHFAYRPLRSSAAKSRSWRPTTLPSGSLVVFHGYFDNASSIAADLGEPISDPGLLYGLAVERWADDADRRILGEYCALVVDPGERFVRVCRSPLRAPPLYYSHSEQLVAAASVPRALFAAGVHERLDETRLADSGLMNFSDQEASWFEGIARVPLGCAIELRPGKPRKLDKYYDPLSVAPVQVDSDAACIAQVSRLLDEAVRTCLNGFSRPGVTLSGGLDSPQIAVRAVANLRNGQKLPTFTFHPEKGYDGIAPPDMIGNERPIVEAFAAMHPQIDPHFTANEGYAHDHRLTDIFHAMGGAPTGLCNMYVFHGLFSGAARESCDVLLVSDWGNYAFSDKGAWGFVEYLLKGRWRQLWMALRSHNSLKRPILRSFIARSLQPLLPNWLWLLARKLIFPDRSSLLDLMQPFSRHYRQASGADRRLADAGLLYERYQPWNSVHARRLLLQNDDGEAAEIYQAFEQLYGVAQRDPMAYRPLVEYCWGLPTKMFMRDGQMRWLAKQMAKGIMPEAQRANRLHGRWDADWHVRIGRRRGQILAEFDRLQSNDRFAAMFDLQKLTAALEDWPAQTETDAQKYYPLEFAVPRVLMTARFIDYVEGRNTP